MISAIISWALSYLLWALLAYFLLSAGAIMVDRRLGVSVYRWYYNRGSVPGHVMPSGMMGFIYNQPYQHRFKIVLTVSVLLSLLVVNLGKLSLSSVAMEFIIAIPLKALVMILGFWAGNAAYDLWLRRRGERSSVNTALTLWRWRSLARLFGQSASPASSDNDDVPVTDDQAWEWQKPSLRRFFGSFMEDVRRFAVHHRVLAWVFGGVLALVLYIERHEFQSLVLTLRIYGAGFIIGLAVTALVWWQCRKALHFLVVRFNLSHRWAQYLHPLGAVVGIALIFSAVLFGRGIHTYVASYWRYETLDLTELTQLPITEHERLWPRQAVQAFVQGKMGQNLEPTEAHLVRGENDGLQWTMAVTPVSVWQRLFDHVGQVVTLSATVPSPTPSPGRTVDFDVGEGLFFSRNIQTCVERGRWFWQSFTTEVSDNVINVRDDAGKWVQVVPIIRWRGWIFPRPEFGGVVVVDQLSPSQSGFSRLLERVFWGCGRYIPARDIEKHAFLRGQNIVPYEVTRVAAESMRYHKGFWAPMSMRRDGDVRIADLSDSINLQPYALYFRVRVGEQVVSKLFHYVSLEPRDPQRRGLAISFWAPADGVGPSFFYHHSRRGESLYGPTAVPDLVKAHLRTYDWRGNLPTEPTPYIRLIADSTGREEVRVLWLVTIVTQGNERGIQVVGQPELALVDPQNGAVMLINTSEPVQQWPSQVQRQFGPSWVQNRTAQR